MEVKSKQRLVGLLILLAILAIFLPLLFHNSHPSTEARLSVKIPPKPKLDQQSAQLQTPIHHEAVEQESMPPVEDVKNKQTAPTAAMPQAKLAPKPSSSESKKQLKKIKAVTTSEQNGLNQFMNQPKAWTVQLGTFKNIENAKRLIEKLRKKGFDAYTRPIIDAKGHHLIRVYVGPEIRRQSALQLKNKLKMTFHIQGVVRKYKIRT